MTTIVSCPFSQGLILYSDTRATDTHSFEKYTANNKTTFGLAYTLPDNVELFISGAGISIGTETLMYPFFKEFELKCIEYCVNLNSLEKTQFIDFFNNIGATYLKSLTPIDYEIIAGSVFIISVKTAKFLGSFKTSITGGLTIGYPTKDLLMGDFVGVGSGSRYVLGALLLEHKKNPLTTRSEEEMVQWGKNYFERVIEMDLASSVESGLNIRIIYKNPLKESKLIKSCTYQ